MRLSGGSEMNGLLIFERGQTQFVSRRRVDHLSVGPKIQPFAAQAQHRGIASRIKQYAFEVAAVVNDRGLNHLAHDTAMGA